MQTSSDDDHGEKSNNSSWEQCRWKTSQNTGWLYQRVQRANQFFKGSKWNIAQRFAVRFFVNLHILNKTIFVQVACQNV